MKVGDSLKTKHGTGIVQTIHEPNFANKQAWCVLHYPANQGTNNIVYESKTLSEFQEKGADNVND